MQAAAVAFDYLLSIAVNNIFSWVSVTSLNIKTLIRLIIIINMLRGDSP
jgi:hypothetical protein